MKAISIPQPWATLIALDECHFQTLKIDPQYTGTIAIHAHPERTWAESEKSREAVFHAILSRYNLTYDQLPFGAIVATAKLVKVHKSRTVIHTLTRNERYLMGKPVHYNDFMLEFREIVPKETPIPVTELPKSLLWDWEPEPFIAAVPVFETIDDSAAEAVAEEEKPKRKR